VRRLPAADSLVGLARAFQDVTGSHPLVLTYAFEALVRQHRVLEPSTVRSNALAPDGDIRKYYGMLWQQLPNHAKDALHLLADTGFIWPPLGLETCLGTEPGELSPAIGHLLHNSEAGQVAFHGSLYAFVREITEHAGRVQVLLPGVVAWLQNQAPRFHRWGWQWLYEARAGDPRNLLARPDRNWVIESLAAAYPRDQVEAILGRAEEIAFSNGDFADAIRIRWLKTRVYNGPQFQVDDYERLHACALQLTDDEYPLKTLASGLQTASIDRLHLLGSQYLLAGRTAEATECLEQMRRRINDRVSLGAYTGDEYKVAVEGWLQLAAGTGRFEPEQILSITGGAGTKDDAAQLLDVFLRELTKKAELAPLMAFVCLPMALVQRVELELACLRLAGALRAKVHEWPAFARFSKHPLSVVLATALPEGHLQASPLQRMRADARRGSTQRTAARGHAALSASLLLREGCALLVAARCRGRRAGACLWQASLADGSLQADGDAGRHCWGAPGPPRGPGVRIAVPPPARSQAARGLRGRDRPHPVP
jgi:hypothetical protein